MLIYYKIDDTIYIIDLLTAFTTLAVMPALL